MTDRIAEIEARLNAASPGPWTCDYRGDGSGSVRNDAHLDTSLIDDARCPYMRGEVRYEDGVFAAAARDDIPYLLARVRELEADKARLDFLEADADKVHDGRTLLLGAWKVDDAGLRAAIDFSMAPKP